MPTSNQLQAAARGLKDVTYRHQGRDRWGVDCAGLVMVAAQEAGLKLNVDFRAYGMLPNAAKLREQVERHCTLIHEGEVGPEHLRPGRLVLMAWKVMPCHMGLVTRFRDGRLGLVHAYAEAGRVVEHSIDAEWYGRMRSVWRFTDLEEVAP